METIPRLHSCSRYDSDYQRVRNVPKSLHECSIRRSLVLTNSCFTLNLFASFLVQESDLRYLVENVWSSQSALSAWEDLYDLVLVRWERHSEWSPWNCCLLTKEEASAHEKLVDLTEVRVHLLFKMKVSAKLLSNVTTSQKYLCTQNIIE